MRGAGTSSPKCDRGATPYLYGISASGRSGIAASRSGSGRSRQAIRPSSSRSDLPKSRPVWPIFVERHERLLGDNRGMNPGEMPRATWIAAGSRPEAAGLHHRFPGAPSPWPCSRRGGAVRLLEFGHLGSVIGGLWRLEERHGAERLAGEPFARRRWRDLGRWWSSGRCRRRLARRRRC